ncbi:MAG TPA: DUF5681 domain-containing protein [Anaeromyxobacteraceae bacterium]|nr:DUF5681 domain-containing protein [Anaeromyxobacteraceae bacterium]
MPWVKGQSGNPKGRPKILPAIRARAKVDSHRAYDVLVEALDDPNISERRSAAVQILKIAGVSFASDAIETKDQAEASKAETQPTEALEEAAGGPVLPLN